MKKKNKSHSTQIKSSFNHFENGPRLTLYGRKPVYEALHDALITPQRLFLSTRARGDLIDAILTRCRDIALPVDRRSPDALARISKNGKQDQGVALDVSTPKHRSLDEALQTVSIKQPIFLIDGVQTPANLGILG